MANQEQLAILKEGAPSWNRWRKEHPDAIIDFREANLSGADLSQADLRGANLIEANLSKANLSKANLSGADLNKAKLIWAKLTGADLHGAILSEADLREADLSVANLRKAYLGDADLGGAILYDADLIDADLIDADLIGADLSGANLSAADLSGAHLVGTSFERADLTNSRIYGIAAWDVKLEGATQKNLIITDFGEPTLTVDNMEVAQFIYLLLTNQKVKDVIDTITSKAVLILGHFTEERKRVLEVIREELRQRDYLPILFDFEPSANRDLTETVTLLARMARFIIVDLTDPKSVPQELTSIIPDLPSVPVQPIILNSQDEYAMYEHWKRYPWVLKIHKYTDVDTLLVDLPGEVIVPAEKFLLDKKTKEPSDTQAA